MLADAGGGEEGRGRENRLAPSDIFTRGFGFRQRLPMHIDRGSEVGWGARAFIDAGRTRGVLILM